MVLFFPDLNSTEKKTASPSIQSQLTKQTEKKKSLQIIEKWFQVFFCLLSWELSWKKVVVITASKSTTAWSVIAKKKMQFTQLQIEVVLILGWLQNSWKTPAPAVNKAKISNLYSAQCANGMFERRDFTAWESFSKAERFFFCFSNSYRMVKIGRNSILDASFDNPHLGGKRLGKGKLLLLLLLVATNFRQQSKSIDSR